MTGDAVLTIGEVAARSGVSVSALRFYEGQGLLAAQRTSGNQRRYPRDVLRRVSFIRVAQRVGVSLDDIRAALDSLPSGRAPTPHDWAVLSRRWRADLDERITLLLGLRDKLDSCIGCGCLSLESCVIWNHDDEASANGNGPRFLLGDRPHRSRRRSPR